MPLSEFELITKYFLAQDVSRSDVLLGVGDDAALLQVPSSQLLVLSTDTLVENIHFPANTLPADLGYKALAVNLSDLAAMGALPAWMTLALTLPQIDETFLQGFATGLFELAREFQVQLVGGDTTRGPLTVTLQVNGFVPPDQALCRHGAKAGDKIYVSGTLGDAGLALQVVLGRRELPLSERNPVLQRLLRPTPRVQLGISLRNVASSAIDISDGLLADLGHILTASGVGATVFASRLPLSSILKQSLTVQDARMMALTAGDDYELCFTVSPNKESELMTIMREQKIECHCIGEIERVPGLRVLEFSGVLEHLGFQHF